MERAARFRVMRELRLKSESNCTENNINNEKLEILDDNKQISTLSVNTKEEIDNESQRKKNTPKIDMNMILNNLGLFSHAMKYAHRLTRRRRRKKKANRATKNDTKKPDLPAIAEADEPRSKSDEQITQISTIELIQQDQEIDRRLKALSNSPFDSAPKMKEPDPKTKTSVLSYVFKKTFQTLLSHSVVHL